MRIILKGVQRIEFFFCDVNNSIVNLITVLLIKLVQPCIDKVVDAHNGLLHKL